MARNSKIYVVPDAAEGKKNRDAGKAFRITEKSAWECEEWSQRALMAAAQAGISIDEDVIDQGVGAVLAVGLRALLTMGFADAKPLLDDMMTCVEFIPDRSKSDITRKDWHDDVEELSTLLALRSEVVEIHTGFSIPAFLSNLGKAGSRTTAPSPDTQTSPVSSET